jgi:hypothetical protein
MKAIRIHPFGPTEDVLQYEAVPALEPKAGVLGAGFKPAPIRFVSSC